VARFAANNLEELPSSTASPTKAPSSSADRSVTPITARRCSWSQPQSEEDVRKHLGDDPWLGTILTVENIQRWSIWIGALPS
jgi:hypothetical protein